jgi:hypothetical protein
MKTLSLSRRAALLIAAAASLFGVACAGDSGQPTYTATDVELNAPAAVGAASGCETGAARVCTIFLGQHGDINNCVEGLDVCSGGVWTGCVDDATFDENPELLSQLVAQ